VRTIPLCVLLPVSFLSVSLTHTCTHPSTIYFCLWLTVSPVQRGVGGSSCDQRNQHAALHWGLTWHDQVVEYRKVREHERVAQAIPDKRRIEPHDPPCCTIICGCRTMSLMALGIACKLICTSNRDAFSQHHRLSHFHHHTWTAPSPMQASRAWGARSLTSITCVPELTLSIHVDHTGIAWMELMRRLHGQCAPGLYTLRTSQP
jgi:hypothetical protein